MQSILLTYPGFQSLPNGIKKMLVASESMFFPETLRVEKHPGATVWLVDDDESLRGVVKGLLEQQSDLRCSQQFGGSAAALEALARLPAPDVILLDINMREESGLDAIVPLRALAPRTRILMFTTFHDHQAESRALKDGAAGFVLKSERLEKIIGDIHRSLERPLPEPSPSRATKPQPRKAAPQLSSGFGNAPARPKTRGFFQSIKAWIQGRSV